MRTPFYDQSARRKTVSVSLNTDLVAKASAAGINISRISEAALAAAFIAHERALIEAELREAAAFTDRIVAEFGPPFGPDTGDWSEPDAASDAA